MYEARWVRTLAFTCGSAVLAFGAVGLVLADAGVYSAAVAFALGLIAWALLIALGRPVLHDAGSAEPIASRAGLAAVVLAVCVGIWNAVNAGQHVLMDRDPAIYNNAARWLAGHGSLLVDRDVGPLTGLPFRSNAPGLYDFGKSMPFQGAHFLPALLAEARGIGGDAFMFRAPAVLGAFALLAFFVVASRVLRNSIAALGCVAVLAFAMPQVFFSRDAYSELPTQVLLFTGLWLLCDERALRHAGVLVVAGLSLGFIQAVRIDGLAIVAGLPPVFAIAWYRTAHAERRRLVVNTIACALAVGIGVAVGVYDLRYRSAPYFADLRGDFHQLIKVTLASAVVSLLVVGFEPVLRRAGRASWMPRARMIVAIGGGILVAIAALLAWLVRPALNPVQEDSSSAKFLTHSVAWLGWYLGPVALVLAIGGAVMVVWALVMKLRWSTVVATALLAPEALLYLWRPNASPDQPWVTRRLIVAAFPAAILLAFAALLAIAQWIRRREPGAGRTVARVALAAVTIAVVAWPIGTVVGVSRMSDEHGYLAGIERICKTVGPDGAIVIAQETFNQLEVTATHPTRSWCGIPVAYYLGEPNPKLLQTVADRFSRQGRTLWIAAGSPDTIKQWLPDAPQTATKPVVNDRRLDPPRLRRPDSYTTQDFGVVLAPVPTT